MKETEIAQKLIKEQDLVCYYTTKIYDKAIQIGEIYLEDPRISYSGLGEYLFEHIEILNSFSTRNLFILLNYYTENKEAKKQLIDIITERLETEPIYCEDMTSDAFMQVTHSADRSFSKLGEENIKKIKAQTIERLQKTEGTEIESIASHLKYLTDASNFLAYFEKGIFTKEKIEALEQMLQKDENALRHVNFSIFQDDIFKLGPEFIKYISRFPNLCMQLSILQRNNPKLLDVLASKIGEYQNLPDSYEEIEILISYLTKNCFEIELSNITPQNVETLTECAIRTLQILGNGNTFDDDEKMINVPYSENYLEELDAEYERRYNGAKNLEAKKNVYLNKGFALSIDGAKRLLQEYAGDIENLSSLTEEEKQAFEHIRQIIETRDEQQIDLLFREGHTIWDTHKVLKIQQKITKECALTYAKEMGYLDNRIKKQIEEGKENVSYIDYNGKNVPQVRLNGKFDIFIHSTDAGFIRDAELGEDIDFVKKWGSGKDKENHIISTAFINQDFLGSTPVNENGLRYGFASASAEKIRLMGVTDLNTYSTQFAYNSKTKQYMSAKTMPYNSRRVYSEFGIERQGTIPDYVVLYDDDLEKVVDNAYKAASQFDIPIIYIDKQEIEREQLERLNSLMAQFNESKDSELLGRLVNEYETNVAGWLLNRSKTEEDNSHTSSIDNSRFKEDFENMWIKIQETINSHIESIQSEDKNKNQAQELMKITEIMLREIELYKDCEKTTPISKTHISFDAEAIISKVNQAFETIGESQYKVDLQATPTLGQYQMSMKEIIKNALSGENCITLNDVQQAERAQEEIEHNNIHDVGEVKNE